MQSAVNYLADLAESSKDSKVVQQQLASVFGIKASDLRAATNLATDNTIKTVYNETLSYDNMLDRLYKMAGTMYQRTSMGEMMSNVWDNVQYTLAGSMSSSPVSYLIYKVASLLESTTGGIDIGLPMVMGNGLPVQFKVSDLMRAASMATGILGTLGSLISGLGSSFSGSAMLNKMGIDRGSGLKVTPRGNSSTLSAINSGGGAVSTSDSGYVGNASGSDVKDKTIQENEDKVKKQVIEAREEEEPNHMINSININVLKIYELLDDVTTGKRNFNVKVAGYGLTSLSGSSSSTSNALGGTAGLLDNSTNNGDKNNPLGGSISSGSGSAGSAGSVASGNNSSSSSANSSSGYNRYASIDLGGWTIR
jgi:hypothetical protein